MPAESPAVVKYDLPAPFSSWNGLVLVGEAPGAEEVKQGRPFVGRSGQLLDKILQQAEIERRQCVVANVFRYQPPQNKVDHFFISRRAAKQEGLAIIEELGNFGSLYCRAAFAGEIAQLRQTLQQIKTERSHMVVVALGRTPLWALTGENGILQKIGKPLTCRLLPGIEVIPTFHPSFILRGNWARQDEWLNHFLTAKKYLS